jgi:beta-glucosidase
MSLPISERVADLVGSMNLTEKVSRMYSCEDTCDTCPCAVPRLGLPAYAYLLEVNTAVAAVCLEKRCATIFSGPTGVGAAFNRTAWQQKGDVISTEVRAFNNHGGTRGLGPYTGIAGFGPNINVARDPRFGRNSELPGEDPFLSGSYAAAMTKGMNAVDAAGYPKMLSYLKHFTAYSRETNRGHDSYAISPFDFGETYLPQYEMGMKEGEADGVMCSYNGENGTPSCANGWLLDEVLRTRWGRHDAVVVTDSGAVLNLQGPPVNASSTAAAAAYALNNGTDVNDGHGFPALPSAIAQGLTTESRVDAALTRSLTQLFRAGLFDEPSRVSWTSISASEINSRRHQEINHELALQAVVLLQNDPTAGARGEKGGALLPLRKASRIAVVGPQAEARSGLLSDYASEQACSDGTDGCIPTITEAIRAENGASGHVTSSPGVEISSNVTSGISAALDLAKAADVVVRSSRPHLTDLCPVHFTWGFSGARAGHRQEHRGGGARPPRHPAPRAPDQVCRDGLGATEADAAHPHERRRSRGGFSRGRHTGQGPAAGAGGHRGGLQPVHQRARTRAAALRHREPVGEAPHHHLPRELGAADRPRLV